MVREILEERKEATFRSSGSSLSSIKPGLQAGDSFEHFLPFRNEGFHFVVCLLVL